MARSTALALVGAIAIVTTGCVGFEYGRAKGQPEASGTYDRALQEGYLNLAQGEFNEGDYRDSDGFADRSIASGKGSAPAPEAMGARKIPSEYVDEMTTARERLVAAMDGSSTTKNPGATAKAQVMFDCWMQEQEENFQPEDIARCRDGFYEALAEIEEPAPVAGVPDTFLVFFDFDSAKLTTEAKDVVGTAATNAKNEDASGITVIGHTDTAGSADYNMKLSQRRADAVAMELGVMGIPAGAITTEARGQEDLLVPTADGVPEAQNRRAEIELMKPGA